MVLSVLFTILIISIALSARWLVPLATIIDPELALPTMAINFLPGPIAGLLLAGIFSSAMSTADSLILTSATSLSRDINKSLKINFTYKRLQISIFFITLIAIVFALYDYHSVFSLVLSSFSILASGFTLLVILKAQRKSLSIKETGIIFITGVITAIYWKYSNHSRLIYGAAPGIMASVISYLVILIFRKKAKEKS